MLNSTAAANSNRINLNLNVAVIVAVIAILLLIPALFIAARDSFDQISDEFASNAGAALPSSFASLPHSEVEPAAYSTADTLTVLSAPDERAQTVSALTLHQGMMVLGRAANNWVKVSLPGNIEGWVDAQYIRANVPVETLPFVW